MTGVDFEDGGGDWSEIRKHKRGLAVTQSYKRQGMHFPQAPEGGSFDCHLAFRLLDSRLRENKFLLFQATKFVAFCQSSHNKQMKSRKVFFFFSETILKTRGKILTISSVQRLKWNSGMNEIRMYIWCIISGHFIKMYR